MRLFKVDGQKLNTINETSFGLEKEIQKITEANLQAIFGLEFVASEYNLEDYWLDTLAFNSESKAFVIIEYKKKQNISIMDQGGTYLNLVLDHKADVLLSYNELINKSFKMKDVSWEQTRVMFIAPNFSPYQKRALHAKLPFELWEVKGYGDSLIGYNKIPPVSQFAKPVPTLTGSARKEIKVKTRDEIIEKWTEGQKDALKAIEEKMFELGGNVEETVAQQSISFKTKKSFLQVYSDKNSLTLNFSEGNKLEDGKKLLKGSGKFGRYVKISSQEQISDIEDYLKQAYKNSFQ